MDIDFLRAHPNAANIRSKATHVVRGKIPARVRKELMAAVKVGFIGHFKRDGLKPEMFFDPRHEGAARRIRADEAIYSAKSIAKAVAGVVI